MILHEPPGIFLQVQKGSTSGVFAFLETATAAIGVCNTQEFLLAFNTPDSMRDDIVYPMTFFVFDLIKRIA